jgi:transcriptional regulator with XRE-family HTH domain
MSSTQELLRILREYQTTPDSYGLRFRLGFAEFILKQLNLRGWTQKKLSQKSGVTEPVITHLIHANQNFTSDLAGRILWAFETHIEFVDRTERSLNHACFSISPPIYSYTESYHGEKEKKRMETGTVNPSTGYATEAGTGTSAA